MPITTPAIKVDAVKNYGGKVLLYGDTFDEAFDYATSLAKKDGFTFIHPYDDQDVIVGGQKSKNFLNIKMLMLYVYKNIKILILISIIMSFSMKS